MSALAELILPGYRRKILNLLLLAPDKQYHVREIARLTGTAAGSLHRELAKLAQAEILLRVQSGNQVYYHANPDCIVYDELVSILRKTSGLVEVLKEILLPLYPSLQAAFVFGSIASHQAHTYSDIDVLVLGDLSFTEVVRALYPAQSILKREINPKLYSLEEWQKLLDNHDAFAQHIIEEPLLTIIGDINDIKQPIRDKS